MTSSHLLEDSGLLEPLRLLLNVRVDGRLPWTLLLIGQTALLPTLERNITLDQRIDIKVLLPAFTAEESVKYVEHRLKVAPQVRPA